MIQLLILYYLSIKSTHGYEIQRFIQINHMDEWNNIQSGSIYYAMNKLERDGFIELVEKIGTGEKSRRIYAITKKGLNRLKEMAMTELKKPLGSITSEKFLIYPIVANLGKDEMQLIVENHLKELEDRLCNIESWYLEKQKTATNVEKGTIMMMKETVLNQIKWHKCLLSNIDETIVAVDKISSMIRNMDFSNLDGKAF